MLVPLSSESSRPAGGAAAEWALCAVRSDVDRPAAAAAGLALWLPTLSRYQQPPHLAGTFLLLQKQRSHPQHTHGDPTASPPRRIRCVFLIVFFFAHSF